MKKLTAFLSAAVLTFLFTLSFNAFAVANGIVCIDSPSDGDAIAESVEISGWSVNTSGVKSVSVYVDGNYTGKARTGVARPDVKNTVSSQYMGSETSGFKYQLDTSSLDEGSHKIKIISYGNNGTTASFSKSVVKNSAHLTIDYPNGDDRHITSDFYISGWSVDISGVKEVEVAIDGNTIKNVTQKRTRSDVERIINPSGYYKDALHSGFGVDVAYNSLSKGTHSVTVTSIANSGVKESKQFDIYIEEPKPITEIDSTSNGSIYINDKLTVSGFAISKKGTDSVKVYVDGKFVGNAQTGIASSDVNEKYNSSGFYTDADKAKFTYTLTDVGNYGEGSHTVKVAAISKDGSETSSTIKAYKVSPSSCVDSPDGTVEGDLWVSGWTANSEGVKSIKIYIDGRQISDVTTGRSRGDVKNYLDRNYGAGAYKDADKSGYSCEVPISQLSNGSHSLKIVATTAATNTDYSTTRTFTVKKASPKSHIDAPSDGDGYLVKGMNVKGWAVNASGVKEVNVYIDGTFACKGACENSRPDVNRIINSSGCYKSADMSGFSVKIPDSIIDKYKPGDHTVRIIAVGNDGESSSNYVDVTMDSASACIDYPSGDISYTDGGLYVSGWSTSASGVKKVDVYVDNKLVGSATTGYERNDVNRIVNSDDSYYDAQHSGFKAVIPSDKISNFYSGKHVIKIISYGYDGETKTKEKTVGKASPHMYIDNPTDSYGILNNGLYVSGWAINASGIKKVDIYVDDKYVTSTTCSYERSDVDRIFNGSNCYYDAFHSGYKVTIPYSSIGSMTASKHIVKVVTIGNDGEENSITRTISRASMHSCLDSPVEDEDYINNSLWVSGWAVAQSGINRVEVYIDDTFVGNAQTGRERYDVDRYINSSGVYYDAVHSGFGYDIPADKLKDLKCGNHTVKVIYFANDGESDYATETIAKLPIKAGLDAANQTVTKECNIKGFALSSSGIKSIQVKYGDNTVNFTSSQLNLASTDIKNQYDKDGEKYANSADCRFALPIDIGTLKLGKNDIIITVTEANGTQSTYNATVMRATLDVAYGKLDKPIDGESYTYVDKTTHVSGWALIKSGISDIKVYLDGTAIAGVNKNLDAEQTIIDQASSAGVTADIAAKARFSTGDINLSSMSYGVHKIEILIYANDGSIYSMQTVFNKVSERYVSYNITLDSLAKKVAAAQSSGVVTVSFDGDNFKYISPEDILKNSYGDYEFLTLNWVDGITAADINKMLEGRGVLEGMGQAFIDAGKKYNINPVYLAAHARIESGNGTSTLSNGVTISGTKYYNQYGIGAVDGDAVTKGSQYAKDHGWDTVEKSIIGGAEWIARNYIWGGKPNQDTLYVMRFNPGYFDGTYKTSSCYCYATGKSWANGIASIMYDYRDVFVGKDINFEFPKFN